MTLNLAIMFAGVILGTAIGIRCSYTVLLESDEFVGKVARRYFKMMEGARDLARAKKEAGQARASSPGGAQPRGNGLVGRVVTLDAEHIQRAHDLRADDERDRERQRELSGAHDNRRWSDGTMPPNELPSLP